MSEETTERVFQYPSAVIRPLQAAELRALALERQVFDEAGLEKYDPYFFSAEISNGRLDSHFTRMAQSTLKNFAADAAAGVSFLYSHDVTELIGRSMGGQFVGGQGNGVARVVADFYITPGLRLGNVESDQIIRAIDSGTLRDVSAGFYGGEWVCSICGNDVWDWQNCRHYPGCKSEVQAEGKTEVVVCTADVEGARLAEESGVYKGSTPGAMIEKATRQAQEGTLEPKTRLYLERHLRIHLPDRRVLVAGHKERNEVAEREAETTTGSAPGAEQGNPPPAQVPIAPTIDASASDEAREVGELMTRAGVANASATTPLLAARALAAECERLKPLADDGTRYRERLRERVVQEQVRAVGTASESFKGMASRATVGELEGLLTDLGAKGDEVFTGGRRTVDGTDLPDEPENPQPKQRAAHSPAYMI
jgi:hypothetical protein